MFARYMNWVDKDAQKTCFCIQIWAQTSWLPCCVLVTKTFTRCSYELHMSFDSLHFHFCEVKGVGARKVWKVTILWLFELYVYVFVQPMSFCFLKELCVYIFMWGWRESKGGGRGRRLKSMLGAWKEKLVQGANAFGAHLLYYSIFKKNFNFEYVNYKWWWSLCVVFAMPTPLNHLHGGSCLPLFNFYKLVIVITWWWWWWFSCFVFALLLNNPHGGPCFDPQIF